MPRSSPRCITVAMAVYIPKQEEIIELWYPEYTVTILEKGLNSVDWYSINTKQGIFQV